MAGTAERYGLMLIAPMLLLATPAQAAEPVQLPRAEVSTTLDERVAGLEDFIDGAMAMGIANREVAGAVFVLVKDGEVVIQKGYGFADVEARKLVLRYGLLTHALIYKTAREVRARAPRDARAAPSLERSRRARALQTRRFGEARAGLSQSHDRRRRLRRRGRGRGCRVIGLISVGHVGCRMSLRRDKPWGHGCCRCLEHGRCLW